MAVRDLTARNAIEDRLWVRIYIFIYIYFLFIFSIEFFEGVSRGGPYRWSMDRSVRWSVDPVRWTGPRTGGQCFRVTRLCLNATFSCLSRKREKDLSHLVLGSAILGNSPQTPNPPLLRTASTNFAMSGWKRCSGSAAITLQSERKTQSIFELLQQPTLVDWE